MNGQDRGYHGLSAREAALRLQQLGPNQLRGGRRVAPMKIFMGQFKDLMVMILLVATGISAFLGEGSEAMTIIVIVLINAVLGFLQEYRTERTLQSLKKLAAPLATVVRDRRTVQVDAQQLVPGDLVLLEAGDRVPADGVLLEGAALSCDESLLTGESEPVEKQPGTYRGETGEYPGSQRVYMGSAVTGGRGRMVVTATGMDTEMGSIAGLLKEGEEEPTPLQQRLDQVGKAIGAGCLLVCALVAGVGMLRGEAPLDMLIVGISLAVAAVPEGLPAIVTISLALAVRRILRRNALVKRLHAVETLGCANVICSDKTGTLTQNRMHVREIVLPDHQFVAGPAQDDTGFRENGRPAQPMLCPGFARLVQVGWHCNNAQLDREGEGASGSPTEVAFLQLARRAGYNGQQQLHRVDELPFDSAKKYMAVAVRDGEGRTYALVKGAPDMILGRCSAQLTDGGIQPIGQEQRLRAQSQMEAMASRALRVVAFAFKELAMPGEKMDSGLVYLGLCGMIDPPRPQAFQAVAQCRQAGIRPVMITGDHALTARAIARELGILRPGDRVLTGPQLEQMDDRQLQQLCGRVAVYARVTPAHKLRIVRALKAGGAIVAMTGDGVNDAPAIKEAHIGVAMGQGGSDVTKEAASLVLLDDNFATLVAAVEEGRSIYQNIRKFIRYLLACNVGEVLAMLGGMLLGMPVLLTPIQLLLVNLVTDSLPAVALGLEPCDPADMHRPPRPADEGVFSGRLGSLIVTRGILIGLATLLSFALCGRLGGQVDQARTCALLTLVGAQLIHVFECKSEREKLFSIPLGNNPALLGAVAVSVSVALGACLLPPVQAVFGTCPITAAQGAAAIGCCLAPSLLTLLLPASPPERAPAAPQRVHGVSS